MWLFRVSSFYSTCVRSVPESPHLGVPGWHLTIVISYLLLCAIPETVQISFFRTGSIAEIQEKILISFPKQYSPERRVGEKKKKKSINKTVSLVIHEDILTNLKFMLLKKTPHFLQIASQRRYLCFPPY